MSDNKPPKLVFESQREHTTLFNLIRNEVSGYKLCVAFFLQIKHGGAGCFPAELKSCRDLSRHDQPFCVSIDPKVMLAIWRLMPSERIKFTSLIMYINPVKGYGYHMDYPETNKGGPTLIIDEAKLAELTATDPNPFDWAPGIMSLRGHTEEEFETAWLAETKNHEVSDEWIQKHPRVKPEYV